MLFDLSKWRNLSSWESVVTVTVVFGGAASTYQLWNRRRNNQSKLPVKSNLIPYVGSTLEFFQSPILFSFHNQETLGPSFWATIFGKRWLFVHNEQDIIALTKAKEKQVSMYQAMGAMAGRLMPQEDVRDLKSQTAIDRIYFGPKWDGPPATAMIAHTVRPQRLRAWVPAIRQLLQENFAKMPPSGTVDLFQWCNDLVSGITVRVMLGEDLARNAALAKQWVQLLRESEPEAAFAGGATATVRSLLEITLFGERTIYRRIRALIYPYLDQEIEDCIAGKPIKDDGSVLSGMVRAWYAIRLDSDADLLRQARRRIANDLFFFTFAAVTNSFGAAAWVLYHVLCNTNGCGDRIRMELKAQPNNDDTSPQLEAAILEVGRLYTPGSFLRLLKQPFVLPSCNETIPAGTMIAMNAGWIHRNPRLYENALEFDPSRFLVNDNQQIAPTSPCYLGFGAGMHPCVGRRFATMEIAVFCSEALQSFDWDLQQPSHDDEDAFTRRMVRVPTHHPALDRSQSNSIWRPTVPILVQYQRKS